MSFLRPEFFAAVREMRRQAFDHTLTPITYERIRQDNGEYEVITVEGDPVMGKLVVANSDLAEEAAALEIEATWLVKLPLGTPPASEYRVTGITADAPWTEHVKVTGHLKGDRINQRLAAVDV